MPARRIETTVRVRGESVPVLILEPASAPEASARDMLFLHGYARHPLDYIDLLEAVSARGWRVVAPFLFANNSLRHPPTQFWACAALALRTVEALRDRSLVEPGAPMFGHSTGGAVALALGRMQPAPSALLAINPVQPSTRRSFTFVFASLWMNVKMTLGLAGEGNRARRVLRMSTPRFYANFLRRPVRALRLVGGLRSFDYERLHRWYGAQRSRVPVRVVWGAGDEFYPHTEGLEAGLERSFEHADLLLLPDENSHEWLMVKADRAAEIVDRALV